MRPRGLLLATHLCLTVIQYDAVALHRHQDGVRRARARPHRRVAATVTAQHHAGAITDAGFVEESHHAAEYQSVLNDEHAPLDTNRRV